MNEATLPSNRPMGRSGRAWAGKTDGFLEQYRAIPGFESKRCCNIEICARKVLVVKLEILVQNLPRAFCAQEVCAPSQISRAGLFRQIRSARPCSPSFRTFEYDASSYWLHSTIMPPLPSIASICYMSRTLIENPPAFGVYGLAIAPL